LPSQTWPKIWVPSFGFGFLAGWHWNKSLRASWVPKGVSFGWHCESCTSTYLLKKIICVFSFLKLRLVLAGSGYLQVKFQGLGYVLRYLHRRVQNLKILDLNPNIEVISFENWNQN